MFDFRTDNVGCRFTKRKGPAADVPCNDHGGSASIGRSSTRNRARRRGMLAYMQRTTVKLPDELDARLRHEAKRRGITVSELTREAIAAHLGERRDRRRLLAAGAGASGRSDVSERIEEILAEELSSP